jgi:hypothetical protein
MATGVSLGSLLLSPHPPPLHRLGC